MATERDSSCVLAKLMGIGRKATQRKTSGRRRVLSDNYFRNIASVGQRKKLMSELDDTAFSMDVDGDGKMVESLEGVSTWNLFCVDDDVGLPRESAFEHCKGLNLRGNTSSSLGHFIGQNLSRASVSEMHSPIKALVWEIKTCYSTNRGSYEDRREVQSGYDSLLARRLADEPRTSRARKFQDQMFTVGNTNADSRQVGATRYLSDPALFPSAWVPRSKARNFTLDRNWGVGPVERKSKICNESLQLEDRKMFEDVYTICKSAFSDLECPAYEACIFLNEGGVNLLNTQDSFQPFLAYKEVNMSSNMQLEELSAMSSTRVPLENDSPKCLDFLLKQELKASTPRSPVSSSKGPKACRRSLHFTLESNKFSTPECFGNDVLGYGHETIAAAPAVRSRSSRQDVSQLQSSSSNQVNLMAAQPTSQEGFSNVAVAVSRADENRDDSLCSCSHLAEVATIKGSMSNDFHTSTLDPDLISCGNTEMHRLLKSVSALENNKSMNPVQDHGHETATSAPLVRSPKTRQDVNQRRSSSSRNSQVNMESAQPASQEGFAEVRSDIPVAVSSANPAKDASLGSTSHPAKIRWTKGLETVASASLVGSMKTRQDVISQDCRLTVICKQPGEGEIYSTSITGGIC